MKIVKDVYKEIPILGVCLGHQVIGQVFKSKIEYELSVVDNTEKN